MAPSEGPERAATGLVVVPDDEWDGSVSALSDDVYFTHAYHLASAHLEPDASASPMLLCLERPGNRPWLLPLLRRAIPGTSLYDATSAYGYGGPLGNSPDPRELLGALDDWARTHRVVTTFLRSHPLEDNAGLFPSSAQTVQLGSTVAWDLSGDDDLESRMHPHHRRLVRRAARAGARTRVVAIEPGDVTHPALRRFTEIYEATMRRRQAARFYHFPDAYWNTLAATAYETFVVESVVDDAIAAALLCLRSRDRLHYHLGGTTDLGRTVGASPIAFLAAARWARAAGVNTFHLGGGLGAGASPLHTFKRRFDPEGPELPFAVGKIVHDPDAYRRLAGTDDVQGFFPPWRATPG